MKFDLINKEWLSEKLSNEQSMMEFVSFVDNLLEPNFSIAALNLSRQELNLWKKEGLIKSNDTEQRMWSRVNAFEYVFLGSVKIMRQFKIDFDVIHKIKNSFFEISDSDLRQLLKSSFSEEKEQFKNSEVLKFVEDEIVSKDFPPAVIALFKKYFPPFNLFVLGLMIERVPINILVNRDGEVEYLHPMQMKQREVDEKFISFFNKPYVSIPMHSLLDEFYENPKIKLAEQQQVGNLTNLETRVLELLRKRGINEIRIKYNQHLKGTIIIEQVIHKNPNLLKNLNQILEPGKFSSIKIVQEDGHIKIFEEVIKEKISI